MIKIIFLQGSFPWPSVLKILLLRIFGAQVGTGVVVKPRVNIHFPWNLSVGDHSWIGEGVEIYNFEQVRIGSNVCISQQVFLCAAGHDYRDPSFAYKHKPICVRDGAWLQARVFVCPGVVVGQEAVVQVGSIVRSDILPNSVCSGAPAAQVGLRWPRSS